jgi:hypothetical protein
MTYDWGENERRLSAFVADVQEKIIKSINPSRYFVPKLPPHFDVGAPYGVVHQSGLRSTSRSPDHRRSRKSPHT